MLTIGSRGSKLALWQAHWVKAQLEARGRECRIEIIQTTGDRITDVPLAQVGSKGLFTKEIEEALLEGRVDLAVHSSKDMPTELPGGLVLSAFPVREDARDAMVGCALTALPHGARIGSSSLRRAAQLRAMRPDLDIQNIRGNVDTRLRKLDEKQYDAILLACAGLKRLGWGDRITEALAPSVMCPAVGQGALAIETRNDGSAGFQAATELDDCITRICVTAERAMLAAMGGGCQVPLGAYAELHGAELHLQAVVVSPDGETLVRAADTAACESAEAAHSIGAKLAAQLLEREDVRGILASVYSA